MHNEVRRFERRECGAALACALGAVGALWWIGIWVSPTFRSWFDAVGNRDWLNGLVLADVVLFVCGHICVGVLLVKKHRFAPSFAAACAGGTMYAWLICAGMLTHGGRWLPVVAMAFAALASVTIAVLAHGLPATERTSQ